MERTRTIFNRPYISATTADLGRSSEGCQPGNVSWACLPQLPYVSTTMGCRTSPTLGIWVHWSVACTPLLQGLPHQPGDMIHSRWQSRVVRSGVGKVSGHSMGIQRINCKCSIRAEWAHGPTGSIQPQPPPNGKSDTHLTPSASPNQGKGPLITRRKHEEQPLTGGLYRQGDADPTYSSLHLRSLGCACELRLSELVNNTLYRGKTNSQKLFAKTSSVYPIGQLFKPGSIKVDVRPLTSHSAQASSDPANLAARNRCTPAIGFPGRAGKWALLHCLYGSKSFQLHIRDRSS
ncbi:hypothetical protein EMCRGX_G010291 [Ephydatia muelleri]